MRLFKLIISLIILCLIGIFVYQNLEVLNQTVSLKYNLYLVKPAPTVKLYLLVLVSLLVGFFLGLTVLLKFHFKTRRRLKRERIEKQQAQTAFIQMQANSKGQANSEPANSSVSNPPGAGKEG